MTAPDWRAFAGCRDSDPLIFFGPENETAQAKLRREQKAKALCYGCPVVLPCRRLGLATGAQHGVWGALSAEELAGVAGQERAA